MALDNSWDDYLSGDMDELRRRTGGNGGIGDTGSPMSAPTPVPAPAPSGPNWGDIERQLREAGGGLFDPSDLEGVIRNTTYNEPGKAVSLEQALANQRNIYDQRRGNTPGQQGPSQPQAAPRPQLPGAQFDDAYSNMLETIAKSQMGEVRSNPGLDQLMQFLTKQFQDLSTNPGYNPAEQAMLNTQAFEPIEANRQASKQRAVERAAARGIGQSSGVHELDLRDIERAADQARTVAGRDLAIAGLDRRDQDLSRALDLGQMLGLTIPRQQRSEEIALGNLLYQMPRTAMQDALSVINGSPSSGDAFSQAIRLLEQQYAQQGRNDAQNAALYSQIGSILANIFR